MVKEETRNTMTLPPVSVVPTRLYKSSEVREVWLRNIRKRHRFITRPNHLKAQPATSTGLPSFHQHQPITGNTGALQAGLNTSSPQPSLRQPPQSSLQPGGHRTPASFHHHSRRVQHTSIRSRGNLNIPPPLLLRHSATRRAHPLSNQLLREMLSPQSPGSSPMGLSMLPGVFRAASCPPEPNSQSSESTMRIQDTTSTTTWISACNGKNTRKQTRHRQHTCSRGRGGGVPLQRT